MKKKKPRLTKRKKLLIAIFAYRKAIIEVRKMRSRDKITDYLLEKNLNQGICKFYRKKFNKGFRTSSPGKWIDKYKPIAYRSVGNNPVRYAFWGTTPTCCFNKRQILKALNLRLTNLAAELKITK